LFLPKTAVKEEPLLKLHRKEETWQRAYATRADFCRIFNAEMKPLYLLAFLLTANHRKAEQCFLAAFADAGKGAVVFREFAASWSRRAVIANAIRLTAPTSSRSDANSDLWQGTGSDLTAMHIINRVAQLSRLERFVFVLCVLERYRDVECAKLLGCARGDVVEARVRALENLATVAPVLAEEARRGERFGCTRSETGSQEFDRFG
jgi:DNA-directed RNA polymerase specialized sigma24 family protein